PGAVAPSTAGNRSVTPRDRAGASLRPSDPRAARPASPTATALAGYACLPGRRGRAGPGRPRCRGAGRRASFTTSARGDPTARPGEYTRDVGPRTTRRAEGDEERSGKRKCPVK